MYWLSIIPLVVRNFWHLSIEFLVITDHAVAQWIPLTLCVITGNLGCWNEVASHHHADGT